MTFASAVLILTVAVLNISLNVATQWTAGNAVGFLDAVKSTRFALAFTIGFLSLLGLIGVYSSGLNLGRGILLMGAVSILGGTLFAVFVRGAKLPAVEWCIFGTLLVLIAYRAITWSQAPN